jgi:hypothetical protein
MNLATFLPFWNSLDSVRLVHSDLEFAAIVFFALLAFFDVLAHRSEDRAKERTFGAIGLWFFGIAVLCELVAYPYGQRNDTLSEQIIGSLDQKSKEALIASSTAVTQSRQAEAKSVSALSTADAAGIAAGKAQQTVDAVGKSAATLRRQLVAQQRRADILKDPNFNPGFVSKIAKFSGQHFDVAACGLKESEILSFSMAIWMTLEGAGWKMDTLDNNSASCGEWLMVFVSPNANPSTREAAKTLLGAFIEGGLAPKNSIIVPIPPSPPKPWPTGSWFFSSSTNDSILVLVGTHP